MEVSDLIAQGAAAAAFAKILVDLVKLSPLPSPSAFLPVLAFVFGEACAFLLAATSPDVVFDRATLAATALVGIGAAAGAIGLTEAARQADR